MLTQLDPPLPMQTPKGTGWAHFVIDYGPESHLLWVVFKDADGACWTFPNPEIRIQSNWSMNRRPPSVPQSQPDAIQGANPETQTNVVGIKPGVVS